MLIRSLRDRAVTVVPAGGDPIFFDANASVEIEDDVIARSLLAQTDRFAPAGPTSVDTSIPGVLAQVGADKGRAQTALDKEQASDKPRGTLVSALNKIIQSEEG